jgi:hypothetical protein
MIRMPNGFMKKAPEKSPFRMDKTERVDPHEGQGIPVTCLNKQTQNSV